MFYSQWSNQSVNVLFSEIKSLNVLFSVIKSINQCSISCLFTDDAKPAASDEINQCFIVRLFTARCLRQSGKWLISNREHNLKGNVCYLLPPPPPPIHPPLYNRNGWLGVKHQVNYLPPPPPPPQQLQQHSVSSEFLSLYSYSVLVCCFTFYL